jgi:endonuclease/exonuclease/phosphatase family metal-dependent hydrolase
MTFSIGSYNIQIPTVKREEHSWSVRRDEICSVLPGIADIISLQEVSYCDEGQGQQVSNQMHEQGFAGYEPGLHDIPLYDDEFHTRNPIFWKKDRFTFLEAETRRITTGTAEEQVLYPNIEPRYCTHVMLYDQVAKETIHVFNLHQQHVVSTDEQTTLFYMDVQKTGLLNLKKFIDTVNKNGNKVFVAGDFNHVAPYADGLIPAKQIADEVISPRVNSYHGYRVPPPQEDASIDHIFTNCRQVLTYETMIAVNCSDHYPIRATFA